MMASGGINSPRRSNGNIDWEIVYSKYIKSIIEGQIAPNTTRGIMYILESRGILKKSDYSGLNVHLTDWRKDGRIDWNDIADGSGRGVFNDFSYYQDPDGWISSHVNFLKNGGENYRWLLNNQWRWTNQPHYVEFWSEKHAVVGTIAAHIRGTYVRVAYQ